MTLLSRKADYALLILSFLHRNPEGGSAREIAEQFGLSRGFVANILKELCQKGFVLSHRGVKGGYVLQRPAGEINLAELLESLDEGFHLTACNLPDPEEECSLLPVCPVRAPIAELHRRVSAVLRSVTLGELFSVRREGSLVPPPALAAHEDAGVPAAAALE
ncbi:MAG TPA: Rrf2 family transcriptional regulator [Gemmataceae bacterium]